MNHPPTTATSVCVAAKISYWPIPRRSTRTVGATLPGFLMILLLQPFSAAAGNSHIPAKPFRALVDASKDGGVWWFPQRPPDFDPAKHHQGKAMADAMRAKGWEVTELPRDTEITIDQLTGFDLVIRPPAFFPYSEAEASAYRESVASGTGPGPGSRWSMGRLERVADL
jgi:hypothetical protein